MTIQLSKNNHVVWGFNNNDYSMRWSNIDTFFIKFGSITRPIKSLREECLLTAHLIHQYALEKNKKIALCYSGGKDSEAMVAAFILANVPFEIYNLRCTKGTMDHDVRYVDIFCKKWNLDYKTLLIDYPEFIRTIGKTIAIESGASDVKVCFQTYILEQLAEKNYLPVVGQHQPFIFKNTGGFKSIPISDAYYYGGFEILYTSYFYAKEKQIDCIPGFFQYTPEIKLSWFKDIMVELISDGIYKEQNSRLLKYYMYKNIFPEFNFESRPKYNGSENIDKELIIKTNQEIATYFKNRERSTDENYSFYNSGTSCAYWNLSDISKYLEGNNITSQESR